MDVWAVHKPVFSSFKVLKFLRPGVIPGVEAVGTSSVALSPAFAVELGGAVEVVDVLLAGVSTRRLFFLCLFRCSFLARRPAIFLTCDTISSFNFLMVLPCFSASLMRKLLPLSEAKCCSASDSARRLNVSTKSDSDIDAVLLSEFVSLEADRPFLWRLCRRRFFLSFFRRFRSTTQMFKRASQLQYR